VVVRARPQRIRVVCWVIAVAVVIVFSAVATSLHGKTGDGPGAFQRGDQLAMIGLGVLTALGVLMLARPSVEADSKGIRVRNVVGSYDLPWEVVRAVTFRRGAPWLALDLHDDDVVAVMAVQAADKGYAVRVTRELRALHAAHQAGGRGEADQQPSAAP
jgi:Bacterial PH domain